MYPALDSLSSDDVPREMTDIPQVDKIVELARELNPDWGELTCIKVAV